MKKSANILARVRKSEDDHAVFYARRDGKLFKVLKIIFSCTAFISVIINVFYLLGNYFFYSEHPTRSAELLGKWRGDAFTIIIATVVMLCSAIIIFFKRDFCLALSAFLEYASAVAQLTVFKRVMTDVVGTDGISVHGLNSGFYWRHLVPLVFACLILLWLLIIAIRETVKTNRAYKNMTEKIFKQYKSDAEKMTDEEWRDFLDNYDPRAEEEKRRRAKRGIPEYNNIITDDEK